MRRPGTLAGGLLLAVVLLGVAAPLACVDLFHSTNFETACDLDAAACAVDSSLPSEGGPTNFCLWSNAAAQQNALAACAWLGACAGPIGDDAFGPCFVHAMLAYDCNANPNRALVPGSAAHAFWDRLWQAKSCADVTGAIFPPKVAPACGASSAAYESCFLDSGTLLSCGGDEGGDDAGAPSTLGFEDCTAFGQVCATSGAVAACAGSSAACTAAGTGCSGTQLQDCDPDASSFGLGLDCASVGAGNCIPGSPSACQATGDACAPSTNLQCNGDLVIGCPSGFTETIDCNALLSGGGGCNTSASGRPWDVSRGCTNGPCLKQDYCEGTRIMSCARGVELSFNCAAGFAGCTTVQLPGDPAPHAACVPAPP